MSTIVASIPAPTPDNLLQVAKAVKSVLDVREGTVGNPLDSNVTFRDLVDAGAVFVRPGWNGRAGTPVLPAWVESDGYDPTQDFTPPPQPTNVTATGLFAMVQLQWDRPTYRNHSYAEIWRSTTNAIGNAVMVATTDASIYADSIGASATRYYWVRFVSQANIKGPYNAVNGLQASTATDPALVIASLTGQITETQLYSTLNSRINLIDGAEGLAGSVNARIATEATTRQTADTALSNQITTLSSTVTTNNTTLTSAIQTEATTRASVDGGLLAQYTVKADVNGYVSGYGLASTANNATPSSSFAVRADNFYIANPSGPGIAPAMPFIVRTTPTNINGVDVPVGVYMTDAFIQNGTITNAKIANLGVDNAKIASLDAAKINTGFLSADRIQAGSLDVKIANINAAVITSGTINTARIGLASISSAQIISLDATKITASSLSSIVANLGTITAGLMQSADGKFVIDLNNKFIRIEV